VYEFTGRDDEAIFALWSDDVPGTATGTIAVFAAGLRYTIPFSNAVAGDVRDNKVLPTPLVVPLARSQIESAYVDSIEGSSCPPHSPYISSRRYVQNDTWPKGKIYPDWTRAWATFLDQARASVPLQLPSGNAIAEPSCAKPYVAAYTIRAVPPQMPYGYRGLTISRLEVAPDGKLIGARVEKRSGRNLLDTIALDAISKSTFAALIYRCEPVSGNYYFYTYWASE
jgi:hypothetical protein